MEAIEKYTKMKNFKDMSSENIDEKILLPIFHVNATLNPCNKVFLGFIQLLNHWISVPEDKLNIIRDIVLNLNSYSAIDDILDYTTLRKGIPTTYTIFGIANTVNAFDFLMCGNLGKVLKLNHPGAMGIYLDTYRGTLAGQGIEVYWRENSNCPTEVEYDQMSIIKSASWLLLLSRLMQLFDDTYKDTEKFTAAVALGLQISDDYNCLTNPKYFESKGFCDDLTEGKFSFPIVHAINTHPEEKQTIINILKQRTKDVELKKQILSILEKCGSFEYTRNKIENLKLVIVQEMEKLGKNPYLSHYFKLFSETN